MLRKREILQIPNFLVNTLKIPKECIIGSFRAGVKGATQDKEGKVVPRPLIVKLASVSLAKEWHGYGRGKYVNGYYVNQDFCKADRAAMSRAIDVRKSRTQTKTV